MRKFIFIIVMLLCARLLSAQGVPFPAFGCDKTAAKVSFPDRSIWQIDGNISDWTTLLGTPTGSNVYPYNPPQASRFNWALDLGIAGHFADEDSPTGPLDVQFLSFTHDDFNVYFYLRRMAGSTSLNTFLYFIDVDADGLMDEGEPVFSANFNNSGISPLKLSRYIPYDSYYFLPGRGNYMVPPVIFSPADPNLHPPSIDKFGMPGSLIEVFTSDAIPNGNKLRKNEVFAAAVTEGGMGVELAIPWRYLRFWKKPGADDPDAVAGKESEQHRDESPARTNPLKPGDIFFYHMSMMTGNGVYQKSNVRDNAGSCCAGTGKSGNVELTKVTKATTLVPGHSYKLKITYKNPTNADEKVNIEHANLTATPAPGSIPNPAGAATITIYPDRNCNGRADPGEIGINYVNGNAVNFITAEIVVPSKGNECFLVMINFPANATITHANIQFPSSVLFNIIQEICDEAGGKAINQVGFVEDDLGEGAKGFETNENPIEPIILQDKILVYPNPSNGTFNIELPSTEGKADVLIQDISGRTIKRISGISSRLTQVKDLQPGVYILKVKLNGIESVKKIIIQ